MVGWKVFSGTIWTWSKISQGGNMEDIKEKYIQYFNEIGEVCLTDYRKNNQLYNKAAKLFQNIEHDRELAERLFDELLNNDNPYVRLGVAVHSISLGLHLNRCKRVLKDIKRKCDGYLQLSADMTLETWKEQGYLLVYQSQDPVISYN